MIIAVCGCGADGGEGASRGLARAVLDAMAALDAAGVLPAACKVFCPAKPDELEAAVGGDLALCDVLVVDPGSKACVGAALRLRRAGNVRASLVLAGVPAAPLPRLLPLRPSCLVAPGDRAGLSGALRACCGEQQRLRGTFVISSKSGQHLVEYRDIRYFESSGRKVTMHARTCEVVFCGRLADVEARLPRTMFVRCHQSYLANLSHVARFDKAKDARTLYLKDGAVLPVSESRVAEVSGAIEALA